MISDGYDAYCHSIVAAGRPKTAGNLSSTVFCGCSEYLKDRNTDHSHNDLAASAELSSN